MTVDDINLDGSGLVADLVSLKTFQGDLVNSDLDTVIT